MANANTSPVYCRDFSVFISRTAIIFVSCIMSLRQARKLVKGFGCVLLSNAFGSSAVTLGGMV